MKRGTVLVLLVAVLLISQGAERHEPHQETIDWETQGFQKMHATAYCVGHHTADGSAVYEGGCACNPHLGDAAIVYTLDGKYLGTYFCNDTGSSSGLVAGSTIDIYRRNRTRCQSFMKIVYQNNNNGLVYVKWISGKG